MPAPTSPTSWLAVANQTLRYAYGTAPRTFQPFCRQITAADFKSGVFKRGTIGEGKESYQVETYGKTFAITRQVIINDDLAAFTRVPQLFGTSAANLESDVVWGIFTTNPAMADSKALSHANLAATGTKPGVEAVGKDRAAMARQTGGDGETILNIRSAFLIVPASLKLSAE
ncbi:MAG: u35 [Xanthobacteraceae bacterium]|nr:MAG: u35 [Xanthobacteraceae bacterium]